MTRSVPARPRAGYSLYSAMLIFGSSVASAAGAPAGSAVHGEPLTGDGDLIVQLKDLGPGLRDASMSAQQIMLHMPVPGELSSKYEWTPVFAGVAPDLLLEQRLRGEARTGRELPDLRLFYRLSLRTPYAKRRGHDVIALRSLAVVENVSVEMTPVVPTADIPPTTPLHSNLQGYLNPAPTGIDAEYAWTVEGGTGEHVSIIDTEVRWEINHEDLKLPELGQFGGESQGARTDAEWNLALDHGTAALGIMLGQHNSYGIDGIVPDAKYGTAVGLAATATALPLLYDGGVLLLEAQISEATAVQWSPLEYKGVPIEWVPEWRALISVAVANGVVVIVPAGNGAVNLDVGLGGQFKRGEPGFIDTGSIMVGARNIIEYFYNGVAYPAGSPSGFSTHGSRIDISAWGDSVFTTYAVESNYPPQSQSLPLQRYVDYFGGTSAASPIVAGAAASVQSIQLERGGDFLDSFAMRNLLKIGATPHLPDTRNVGGTPNLRAIIEWMPLDDDSDGVANVDELAHHTNPAANERIVAAFVAVNSLLSY